MPEHSSIHAGKNFQSHGLELLPPAATVQTTTATAQMATSTVQTTTTTEESTRLNGSFHTAEQEFAPSHPELFTLPCLRIR